MNEFLTPGLTFAADYKYKYVYKHLTTFKFQRNTYDNSRNPIFFFSIETLQSSSQMWNKADSIISIDSEFSAESFMIFSRIFAHSFLFMAVPAANWWIFAT